MSNLLAKTIRIILIFIFLISLNSCGVFRMTDAREVSPNPDERVEKNINEGRGLRLGNLNEKNTNFQFASSNAMWRASLDVLDFAPLINANYSGGIIITDWISADTQNEFFKITIKFLSNEIRPDGLDVVIHQKICNADNYCNVELLKSSVNDDLKIKILKRAALYASNDQKKLAEELGEYKIVPIK